jgi:hypothetical protein
MTTNNEIKQLKTYNDICFQLQGFMLTNQFLDKNNFLISPEPPLNNQLKSDKCEEPVKKVTSLEYYIPDEKDKLFWCFYIILYGIDNYEFKKASAFTIEKEFKIQAIQNIRKDKKLYKQYKLRISEIEDELLNHNKITLKSLYALCILYKKNIIYAWNRQYVEINVCPESEYSIICQVNKQEAYIVNELNKEKPIQDKITYYRNNYWKIENVSKPLKGFSIYSLKELTDIAKKLEIPELDLHGKRKLKKILYQNILQKL